MKQELPEAIRIRCLRAAGDWCVGTEEQLLERWRSDAPFRSKVLSGDRKHNSNSTGSTLLRTLVGLLLLTLMVSYVALGDGEYHPRRSCAGSVTTGSQVLFLVIAGIVGLVAWAFASVGVPVSSPIIHEAMQPFGLGIDALVIGDERIPLGHITAVVDLGGEVEVHLDELESVRLRFSTIDDASEFCESVQLRQAARAEVLARAAREGGGYRAAGDAPTDALTRALDEDARWDQVDGNKRAQFALALAEPA